jgi:hypothetical protein
MIIPSKCLQFKNRFFTGLLRECDIGPPDCGPPRSGQCSPHQLSRGDYCRYFHDSSPPSKFLHNIGIGIDTDSGAASDTHYRVTIGVTFKKEYRKGIEAVSIDTPIPILHLCLKYSLLCTKK